MRYDKTFYRRSLNRVLSAVPAACLADLRSRYEAVVAQISKAACGLCPRRVLSGKRPRSRRPAHTGLPVDWELCGLATGPLDFAALTTGLPEAEANLLVEAYVQKLPETPRDLGQLLEGCRLHLAIEWLGRSKRWTPPFEHARDWAAEALAAAKKLNLVA